MKSVIIEREFDGYPNGEDKKHVTFLPAVDEKGAPRAVDVDDSFADMIVKKGLARFASAPEPLAPASAKQKGA